MTIMDLIERDARAARGRSILKTVGDVFGEDTDSSTPKTRIEEREQRIVQIKRELERMNGRDYADMSVSDRVRHRELRDEMMLLDTKNFEDKQLMQREQAVDEKIALHKARPRALAEARERLATLRKCAASVESGHARLGEMDLRRLRLHLSRCEIEIAELSR